MTSTTRGALGAGHTREVVLLDTWLQPARDGFARISRIVQDAVDAAITRDPDPADPFRGLYITDEHAGELASQRHGTLPDERLALLADRLGFDQLDVAVLGLVAAPEIIPGYGRLYAYLHDDVTRKLPSTGLICRLLATGYDADAVRERLGVDAPLRRTGALRVVDESIDLPVQDRPLRVADVVANHLVGVELASQASRSLRRRGRPHEPLGRPDAVDEIREHLDGDLPLVIVGTDATALLAEASPRPLLVIDAADLGEVDLVRDAQLVAALEDRLLCIEGLADIAPDDRAATTAGLDTIAISYAASDAAIGATLTLGERSSLHVSVPETTQGERRDAWLWFSGCDDVEAAAAKYRLSVAQIGRAAELAVELAGRAGVAVGPEHLDAGARHASEGALGDLATLIRPAYTWDQLVLPERPLGMLRSIFGFLRHRDLVLTEWGYERALAQNQGIKVLFAGDSGTGKTMAAQVLGRELGLEIFRVDLAGTVSKYIGETEKNLDRIFAAAEGSNAMLFFDEADALFGKRSDVGDAHDRYANLETAYLLQRMEGYPGAVILATNYRHNIDEAFLRRLDVVIDFPFPDEKDRERIWRVALPASAPVADDLDITFLATKFKLSGGGIRNASLAAAFLAADDGGLIRMDHLVQGVANEYAKLGRLTMETEFERFHGLVTGTSTASTSTTDDADAWALSSSDRGDPA